MKKMFGFRNTAITVGVAFMLSGVIKLIVRGTMDTDIFVGAVFIVFGVVIWLTGRHSSE